MVIQEVYTFFCLNAYAYFAEEEKICDQALRL